MRTKLHKGGQSFAVADPVQVAAFVAEGWSPEPRPAAAAAAQQAPPAPSGQAPKKEGDETAKRGRANGNKNKG